MEQCTVCWRARHAPDIVCGGDKTAPNPSTTPPVEEPVQESVLHQAEFDWEAPQPDKPLTVEEAIPSQPLEEPVEEPRQAAWHDPGKEMVALDVEATGLRPWEGARPRLVSLSFKRGSPSLDLWKGRFEEPLTVEEAAQTAAGDQPPRWSRETPYHQIVADTLADPDWLLILAFGGDESGKKLLNFLLAGIPEYPLVAFAGPSSIDVPTLYGCVDLRGGSLVEIQAMADVMAGTPGPTNRMAEPGILVMQDRSEGSPARAYEIVNALEISAIREWARTGVFTPMTMGDAMVAAFREIGIHVRRQSAA